MQASIDLGTGAIKVAHPDGQGEPVVLYNRLGGPYTPSVVFLGKDAIVIGEEAINAGFSDPARCVRDFKRHMGTDKVLATAPDGKPYRAKDIAAILLDYVKKDFEAKTGQPLKEVVICVPANYNDAQKSDTLEAAKIAGLNVLLLVSEPTAAALGNKVHRRGDGIVVILDLGHGTFDVSILKVSGNNIDVLSTSGVSKLGGTDFNAILEAMVLDAFERQEKFRPSRDKYGLEFHELGLRIEQAKRGLSVRDQVNLVANFDGHVLTITITRKDFETRAKDLVQQAMDATERALQDVGVKPSQVKEYIAVGGASAMPMIHAAVENRFGQKPSAHVEPYFAAALGAVLAGRMELERQGRQLKVGNVYLPPVNVHSRDVTSHPYGVCVEDDNHQLHNSVILPKGVPIPSDQTASFRLSKDDQTSALIEILQGPDGAPRDQCLQLGHFELTGLQPAASGIHRIEVRMKIDRNGMLNATAYDPLSGKSCDLAIDYKNTANATAPSAPGASVNKPAA